MHSFHLSVPIGGSFGNEVMGNMFFCQPVMEGSAKLAPIICLNRLNNKAEDGFRLTESRYGVLTLTGGEDPGIIPPGVRKTGTV